MKKISSYFKHQSGYLLFLLGVFVVPLYLYMEFSPYHAEKLPSAVLAFLVVSQYAFYREKEFRKKIEGQVTTILQREVKRVPSRSEIIQRSSMVIQFRGVTIGFCALLMLIMMFAFNQF
jgi:hypothetical protein